MSAEPGRSLERDILDRTFWVFVAACGYLVFFVVREVLARATTPFLFVEALALAAATIGLHRRQPHAVRARALLLGTGLVASAALLHYGPLLGTGFILALTPIVASLFFGRRGGLLMGVFLGALILAVGALVETSTLAVTWTAPGPFAWIRMTITSLLCAAAMVVIVDRALSAAREQIAARLEALEKVRAAEAEQARVQAELARQAHHAALGRLASGVAHEVNTALGAVALGLDALRKEGDRQAQSATIDAVSAAAERARRSVRRIAVHARRAPETDDRCEPAEVAALVAEAAAQVVPGSVLTTELAPTPRVGLPTALLEQALLHLCVDAAERGQGAPLSLRTRRLDGATVIELAGVPADFELPPLLFEAARRAAGRALREGTVVRLELPEAAPARESPATPLEAPARVLLLEDDDVLRPLLTRVLERGGHSVHACADAAAARTALDVRPFDLLVTDAIVPGGGVPSLIAEFRTRGQGPVLVCSGQVDEDEVLDGIDRKDLAFLAKPFTPDVLLRTLATLRARYTA